MRIVQINTFPNKSTGTIMMNIHKYLLKNNIESYVIWGRGRQSSNNTEISLNDKFGVYYHALYTRLTDKTGFASRSATKKLIKLLEEINPDIVHLHNTHGYYINVEILFKYLKNNNTKVIWTFHDCWPFTGHCAYFDYIKCEKWKHICYNCPQIKKYPKSLIDNSTFNYKKKKELFLLNNLVIVTPSIWLKKKVQKSFFQNCKIEVINNGIDTTIFKPCNSEFRRKYNLLNKKIILGVANVWDDRKGLKDFIELSKHIDAKVVIVLIGLNKKQIKKLPKNILGLPKTENIQELVEIYNAADIFFNPTYDDNYPTTNLEALACEIPVITYNTGGSPESLNRDNGIITDLKEFCQNYKLYLKKKYIINDREKYSKENMVIKYMNLYLSIIKNNSNN